MTRLLSVAPSLLTALVLFFVTSTAARAALPPDSGWQLVQDKGGIKIFTRDTPGSDFQAFKATTRLDAPLASVIAVMNTPSSCMEWVHGCEQAYNLQVHSFNDRIAYSINNLPWPVEDRDYVLEITTQAEPKTGDIIIRMHTKNDVKPISPDFVRVTDSDTFYRFHAADATHTDVTWIQHTDPNGSLPSWLVNRLLVDIPYESLRNLNKLVGSAAYQGYRLDYNGQGQVTGVSKAAQ